MFYERARKAFAVVHTGYVYTVCTQCSTLQLACMERCCLMGKSASPTETCYNQIPANSNQKDV